MELPNYGRQFMQQLHTLRKEGRFCDCTILVGDTPYRAHKLVLAASSLLFKSLLEGSDSISIDTSVVSAQEFASLLEMVYTGRLPPGKHNFTRVIAVADSLQMFDVAVSCKNILTSLMRPPVVASTKSPVSGNPRLENEPVLAGVRVAESRQVVETRGPQKEEQTPSSSLDACPQEPPDAKTRTECLEKADRATDQVMDTGLDFSTESKDLEFLSQSREKIVEIVGDVHLWVKAVQMWEGISAVERQVILDCCREESDGPSVIRKLLNMVMDRKCLSAYTVFSILDLLKERYPELIPVLQRHSVQVSEHQDESPVGQEGLTGEARSPFAHLLLGNAEKLVSALSEVDTLADRLATAARSSMEEYTREMVSECCRSGTPREVAKRLIARVKEAEGGSNKGVAKDTALNGLLTLLRMIQDSSPALQKLLVHTDPQEPLEAKPTGLCQEADESELLKRYHSRILEAVSDPQPLLQCLKTMAGFPSKEKECAEALLQQAAGAQVVDKLLSAALQGSAISVLSVWRMLFMAGARDPSLESLIQEVREQPGVQKLVYAAMDPEGLHVDLLLKHKALVLQVTETIADLEAGIQTAEGQTEGVTEFLSTCKSQGENLTMADILSRVLEQSLPAQPFCRLLALNQQVLPLLHPLFHDMKQAGKETTLLKSSAEGFPVEEFEASDEQQMKKSGKQAAVKQCFCQWCGKAFAFRCRMEVHRKRCRLSQEASQHCPHCSLELATPLALQQHLAEAHEGPPRKKKRKQELVACDLCGKTFAHPSGMLYHKRTDHFDEKPYSCEECGAKFAANSSLKNHQRLHTGERPFRCKHCDMSFSQAAALSYHSKKKHSEGKMYACQYCEAVFAQSIELTRHVRTHTGDKPYVCRECGKGFSQANGLSVHLHTFHNISDPHDCQKCRMSFSSLEEHRKHIQECHPKEYHQCNMCSKIFNSSALLEKHVITHVGGKPYNCKICHKAYQQLSGLWYHNRITHPEVFAGQGSRTLRSFVQCPACSRAFPSNSSLLKHQKHEHPEGIFECEECKDTFPELQELEDHKKEKHSGEELHLSQCPYCPSSYATRAEMQLHVCTQHLNQEGDMFSCAHCELLFSSQLELQDHFLSHHQEGLSDNPQSAPSQMVIQTEESPDGPEQVITLDQSQVYVALADSESAGTGSEIVAVNMEDLLDGTITFICGENQ
ncbi:zinc finger and BTB domain-containing protein 40 [Scleropages formosus]|uniref:Zinc finger and BTB domain containing 40 n=1 Tax=Scleropages formosus TaxID=113540 RepID=A0A8C9SD72_SCLFO|nr:zinc finger and BTB domain-containing protein 40 [Scleropages formosus]